LRRNKGRTEPSRTVAASDARCGLALALVVGLCISACGSNEQSGTVGTRQWGPYEVSVETRPSPPRPGQNEVVVIIVGERHQPLYDALVTVRANASSPWVQAIEDGHVGVYRRAVKFGPEAQSNLQVQVQHGPDSTILDFPVSVAAQP